MSESELIRMAIAGDQDAFAQLYADNYVKVFSFLLQRTKNREDAEDLASIVFAAAFRALPTFAGRSKFSTWLHKIASNYFLMRIRRGKGESKMDSLDAILVPDGESIGSRMIGTRDAVLESFHARDAIMRCASVLSDAERDVFLLRSEGYTHEEIAEKLGCSKLGSKSRTHRAIAQVRNVLNSKKLPPRKDAIEMSAFSSSRPNLPAPVTFQEAIA